MPQDVIVETLESLLRTLDRRASLGDARARQRWGAHDELRLPANVLAEAPEHGGRRAPMPLRAPGAHPGQIERRLPYIRHSHIRSAPQQGARCRPVSVRRHARR